MAKKKYENLIMFGQLRQHAKFGNKNSIFPILGENKKIGKAIFIALKYFLRSNIIGIVTVVTHSIAHQTNRTGHLRIFKKT